MLDGRLGSDDVSVIFSEKQQIIKKSGLLEYYEAQEDFSHVAGLENLKQWLVKRQIAFTERAARFGLPSPRGVMLLGVQGCGKSLCAKAVSSLWTLPLLRFDIGQMFSSLVGSSEENIRRAIQTAESVAPAILWIDEIDKALAGSTEWQFERRGHFVPRVRHAADLAVGEDFRGVCDLHGQRYQPPAA